MDSEIYKKALRKREQLFDAIRDEFLSGELDRKIALNGKCDYCFEKLGLPKTCDREKRHIGAHMFGIKRYLAERKK